MSLKSHAQSMEAKWRLKAPEAFYSSVSETAPADDTPNPAPLKDAYRLGWNDGQYDASTDPGAPGLTNQASDVVAGFLHHLLIPDGVHHRKTWIDYCNGYCDGAALGEDQCKWEKQRMMAVFEKRNGKK